MCSLYAIRLINYHDFRSQLILLFLSLLYYWLDLVGIPENWWELSRIQQSVSAIPHVLVSYFIAALTLAVTYPVAKKAKAGSRFYNRYQQLIHTPEIFMSLLKQQGKYRNDINGLGINIGNKDALFKVTKICNPYCGPCSKTHAALEELLSVNENVELQIIFLASNDQNDKRNQPVRHLLAIADQGDISKLTKALDDWYLSPEKDYNKFSSKYPLNGELNNQHSKIEAMRDWCKVNAINSTPTFFVNGHRLPSIYDPSDFKYLFTSDSLSQP